MPRATFRTTLAGLSLMVVTGAAAPAAAAGPGAVDILFMVDNSSSMGSMQAKLAQQMQGFVSALQTLPGGFPDVHIAVVSSDMGAPGDVTAAIGCTLAGDGGQFHFAPVSACNTTLDAGATFISNVGGVANYTGNLADVLSCILPLGDLGCGFEHQLASVARALGADGSPAPAANAGFLRPDAELAIILLTNEDDCSAPADTTLYSLNGGLQSTTNPLGPVANYRCNQFGHLCKDPTGSHPDALITPPLHLPADAVGTIPAGGLGGNGGSANAGPFPTLALTACESDDTCSGMLTPVVTFAHEIMALKADPSQIVVGAIVAPPAPYTVEWVPPAAPAPNTHDEIWPQVMHSCGTPGGDDVNPAAQATNDGSFGDPGVRVSQWAQAFGDNGFTASICDADYSAALQTFATKIGQHFQPSGATQPPAPTGPLATSPACGPVHPNPGGPLHRGGCSAAGGRPGSLALFIAGVGLGLVWSRRRRRT